MVVEVVVVSVAKFSEWAESYKFTEIYLTEICHQVKVGSFFSIAQARQSAATTQLGQVYAINSRSFNCSQKHMSKVSSPSSAARINAHVEQV